MKVILKRGETHAVPQFRTNQTRSSQQLQPPQCMLCTPPLCCLTNLVCQNHSRQGDLKQNNNIQYEYFIITRQRYVQTHKTEKRSG